MYVREPAVAGSFYPGDPDKLVKVISSYLDSADTGYSIPGGESLIGIVSPHAGYIYSGPVAAYGFRYIEQSALDRFIVLAPSHYGRFNGASVIPSGLFRTPLGDVEIDSSIGERLVKREKFSFLRAAHDMEHSLEVQIPFLQRVKPGASIVPVVIGTIDPVLCRKIGETIAEEVIGSGRRYGIIISTDLSHYHPYDQAVNRDNEFIKALESFDAEKVEEVCGSGKGEACGEGGILAGIALAKGIGGKKIHTVKYANSGDTAGSKDQVVGYLSALITG